MWIAACALTQPEPPPIVSGNCPDFEAITFEFPLQMFIRAAKPSEKQTLRNRRAPAQCRPRPQDQPDQLRILRALALEPPPTFPALSLVA